MLQCNLSKGGFEEISACGIKYGAMQPLIEVVLLRLVRDDGDLWIPKLVFS